MFGVIGLNMTFTTRLILRLSLRFGVLQCKIGMEPLQLSDTMVCYNSALRIRLKVDHSVVSLRAQLHQKRRHIFVVQGAHFLG